MHTPILVHLKLVDCILLKVVKFGMLLFWKLLRVCLVLLPPINGFVEGNFFCCVCLPVFLPVGAPCDHYPWYIWRHCTGLPMAMLPLLVTSGRHHWRPVQTCSLEETPPPYQYWHLMATKVHLIGKQVVRILPECFLVLI